MQELKFLLKRLMKNWRTIMFYDYYYPKDAYLLESQSRWDEAAKVWRRSASTQPAEYRETNLLHAAACEMLAKAIRKGDAFRARVEELKAEAAKCPRCGEVMNEDEILRQADKEIYHA
jgi:hypothetical protein